MGSWGCWHHHGGGADSLPCPLPTRNTARMAVPVSPSSSRRIARAVPVIMGVCGVLVVAGVASFVLRGAAFQEYYEAWVFQNAPGAIVGVAVFGLALRQKPSNRAARYFFAGGVLSSVHVATMGWGHARAAQTPELWERMVDGSIAVRDIPGDLMWPLWVAVSIWLIAAAMPVLGLLHFPDGQLPSPRWRPVVWLAVAGITLGAGSYWWASRPWSPHPLGYNVVTSDDRVAQALFVIGMPILGLAGLLTIASLVVRMRSADPQERRRVRPVVTTGSLFVAVMVVLYPWQALWATVTIPAIVLFLVTTAASVARYRLFEVEVAVSRTVTVAILGLIVALAYVGIVAGVGGLLGTGSNLWVSVSATAVIAVGFEPLRRRVTAAATRLVIGTQATPYETLAQLSDRLARADSTGEVLERVVDLLVEGTGAVGAEVRTRLHDGTMRLDAASGESPPDPAIRSAPVANAGELLGEVRLLAARDDRFLAADERLLHQVAAAIGPVVRNARLTRELQDNIEQLRASQQRIVTAHDEARRAVERDIHDGAQQQLLSLRLKLGLAATLAERDGADQTVAIISDAATDADAAIRRLRNLARGLYPPVLAEQGLETALRAHAREVPLPVTVEADAVGRYDRTVESTVYFCCLEAMHNATKHADASSLRVELADGDGTLRFAVIDDGTGFDDARASGGTGLANMTDRVSSLGGDLEVESSSRGTVVRGRIPTQATSDDQAAVSER